MIKYIGSKRRLVPVLARICEASGARSALDLFTGTTRVAQAFKAQGVHLTAVDSARYAYAFARTYIEADAATTDSGALTAAITHLNSLPGREGYVTEMFSRQARFFQAHNAMRIDAARDAIDSEYAGSPLFPLLLTSLIEAADRVDSTTGVQMAYVKEWAPRSYNPLELRVPELLAGGGRAIRGDAVELVHGSSLGHVDLAYLDPPYNQHRYFTNYHVWETLVAWDAPESYGVARKRVDCARPVDEIRLQLEADDARRARLGGRRRWTAICWSSPTTTSPGSSWRSSRSMCGAGGRRDVATLAFDSTRYVGARIGIFDPSGRKVGRVSHLSNQELLVIAGDPSVVRRVIESVGSTPLESKRPSAAKAVTVGAPRG